MDGLLIDTACANTAEELLEALSGSVPGLPPVRVAVNTHYHEDHVAANRLLSERLGVTVLAQGPAGTVGGSARGRRSR